MAAISNLLCSPGFSDFSLKVVAVYSFHSMTRLYVCHSPNGAADFRMVQYYSIATIAIYYTLAPSKRQKCVSVHELHVAPFAPSMKPCRASHDMVASRALLPTDRIGVCNKLTIRHGNHSLSGREPTR
eukprot:6100569-Amphidinium_carterae.1